MCSVIILSRASPKLYVLTYYQMVSVQWPIIVGQQLNSRAVKWHMDKILIYCIVAEGIWSCLISRLTLNTENTFYICNVFCVVSLLISNFIWLDFYNSHPSSRLISCLSWMLLVFMPYLWSWIITAIETCATCIFPTLQVHLKALLQM